MLVFRRTAAGLLTSGRFSIVRFSYPDVPGHRYGVRCDGIPLAAFRTLAAARAYCTALA